MYCKWLWAMLARIPIYCMYVCMYFFWKSAYIFPKLKIPKLWKCMFLRKTVISLLLYDQDYKILMCVCVCVCGGGGWGWGWGRVGWYVITSYTVTKPKFINFSLQNVHFLNSNMQLKDKYRVVSMKTSIKTTKWTEIYRKQKTVLYQIRKVSWPFFYKSWHCSAVYGLRETNKWVPRQELFQVLSNWDVAPCQSDSRTWVIASTTVTKKGKVIATELSSNALTVIQTNFHDILRTYF